MRRFFRLLFLYLFFAAEANAQEGFVHLQAGYGLPMGATYVDETVSTFLTEQNGTIEQMVTFSLGEGVMFSVAAGGYFFPGFGAAIRLHNCMSRKIEVYHESNIGSTLQVNEQTIESSIWSLTPEFRIMLPDVRLSPFMTFGMSFTTGKVRRTEKIDRQGIGFTKLWEFSGKFPASPSASAGLLFAATDNIQLSMECRLSPLSYLPDKVTMTKATRDGSDNLLDYPTIEKEVNYVDQIITEYGTAPDPDKPDQRLRTSWPAGSIQFVWGIVFVLGK